MDLNEAIEWLEGKRSMINIIPSINPETWHLQVAQSDAAMTQRAYFMWLYSQAKGLIKEE
jgi:peroxiredoxin